MTRAAMAVTLLVFALTQAWPVQDPPKPAKPVDPADAEKERVRAREEALEASAKLIDKLFLGGKLKKLSDALVDPATYREYAELAYSMNPIDLYYYATPDYKKELAYNGLMTVVKRTTKLVTPIVGFEITMGLEALDHMIKLKKDQQPFKLTKDIRAKFHEATKELMGLEGKAATVYDFLFVEKTANDAIREIKVVAQAYREAGDKLAAAATEVRRQEAAKKADLVKQIAGQQEEAKRLQGLITPDVTPARKQELEAQILGVQRAAASLQQQAELCDARVLMADRLASHAELQKKTAVRFERIADGVKDNLPLLAKLAAYLQKNKEGIPVTDIDEVIETCQEVAKKERDWKGEFEDLYEIATTKGFSELWNRALDHAMAVGGEAYQAVVDRLRSLTQLQTYLDYIKQQFDNLGVLVRAGANIVKTFYRVLVWQQTYIPDPLTAARHGVRIATGEGTKEEYEALRDAANRASDLIDKIEKLDKKIKPLKELLEWVPEGYPAKLVEKLGMKEEMDAVQKLIGDYEKEKKALEKYLAENSDLYKAKKWWDDKQKNFKEFKKEWETAISILTDVIGLLDKDMPRLDLAPDQEFKDLLLGWFGGKGTMYTGFATVSDETSGINPKELHLFYYDVAAGTNHAITDVKVIPTKQTEHQLLATRIQEARVRYRFQPPDPGDYIVWGYVRDRAGHASCALANTRHSQQEDHAKWKYEPEKPEDRRLLEGVRKLMEELGINPDEVFRKRDFHQVTLKLKADPTPPLATIHEPYNRTDQGLDPNRPLRFHFEVEDPESWFNPADVQVWITDEYGRLIWESLDPKDWQITRQTVGMTEADKFRAEKTGMVPKAVFEVPGAKHEGPGIYFACVQVTNGAGITNGHRTMFFLGNVRPWTLVSDVRPFKAVYQQGDELRLEHTFWNIKDGPVEKVRLEFKSVTGPLAVVGADATETVRPIATGQREKLSGFHAFKVSGKPERAQKALITYECTLHYGPSQPDRKVIVEVPINLHDEDAEKVHFVKGSLHYQYQKETRPVPFGTALSVSQVYQMPALGTPKWVEQYVGYGEVSNDAGDFFIRVSPAAKAPYRLRLVAKTYARERDPEKGPQAHVGIAGVFGLETSYPLTCITTTFDVSVASENVFRNNVYDVGTKVIPYYSSFMEAPRRNLIPIPWEGELSTGGYISPYGHDFADNPYRAFGTFLGSINVGGIDPNLAMHGQDAPVPNVTPGINAMETGIRHANFNGGLAILGTLVKCHRFTKQLAYLAKNGAVYQSAQVPLAFERSKPIAGKPPEIVATPEGLSVDVSTRNVQKVAKSSFPFRTEVIRELHVKEAFYEEHEIVYQSDRPPPVDEYVQLQKQVKETRYHTKRVPVKLFVIADTKNHRVVELELSAGTAFTALADKKEPTSAEKLSPDSYLVCLRGENKVAIFRNGLPIWSWGEDKPETRDVDESLKTPEFAVMTGSSTVLICEGGRHRVLEVDVLSNRILWSNDGFVYPVMAQLTIRGTTLVCDRDGHQVVELDGAGKPVWSFGTKGQAGSGPHQLNRPQSVQRAGDLTLIADAGNQRILHVGADGQLKRSVGPIYEVKTNPMTGKEERIPLPLDQLAFAARYGGIDYLLNGDHVYSVDDQDRMTGRWGGPNRLASPEHLTMTGTKATVRVPEEVIREEPYYVWKQSVKVVKKPLTRVYLDDPKQSIGLDPKYREAVPAVGATANYAPGHRLAAKHGLHTAGVALNQGRLRIYVDGGNDNADDNDPHVIARAFGHLLRNRLIRRELRGHDYLIQRRVTPREAWERGWDTFIACAVTENPRFIDKTFLGQEIPNRTFDLAKTYGDMLERYRKEPATLERDFHNFRGLDSPFALAMLFHEIYRRHGVVLVNHAITFARGGTAADGTTVPEGRYIDPATLLCLYPDMRETFEVLGLVPRLKMRFPANGVLTLNTAYPKLEWDAEGLLEDLDNATFTLVISEDRPDNVVQRITGIRGQAFDFGQILKPEEAAAKLARRLNARKVYYWRVEVEIDDGPVQYRCSSPWGAFEIEVKSQVIGQNGGEALLEGANPSSSARPLRPPPLPGQRGDARAYGVLKVPEGALAADLRLTVQIIQLPRELGDFEAVHQRVFDLNGSGVRFARPATLEFAFTEHDLAGRDPRGLGIYRFDPSTARWEYVGGKWGNGVVAAEIDAPALFALLWDKRGPEFLDVHDAPDHAFKKDTLTIRFGLRKPTRTTVTVFDAAKKPVRVLGENVHLSGAANTFSLPLEELPEGRYTYRLEGTDLNGVPAAAVERTFLVSEAPRGAVRGRVRIVGSLPSAPLRVFIPDTSITSKSFDSGSEFLLTGVAPGRHEVMVWRPGLFPETVVVDVQAGETVDLGEVRLTDRLFRSARPAHVVFTPNNDGDRDYAVLELDAERAGLVRAFVESAAGKRVATITPRLEVPLGRNVLVWRGLDDRGRALPSGWYSILVEADAAGAWTTVAQTLVLLDRGLVRNLVPLPRVFSPNGDGFEDEIEFSYLLEAEASVTVEVYDSQGRLLAVPAKDLKQQPGANTVTWNGKTADGQTVADGRYKLVVRPRYVTGQASLTATGEFLVDAVPPEIAELTPKNGQKLADGRPTITARVKADAGDIDPDGLRFKIDEHTVLPDSYDPATGVFTFRPHTALGEGVHIAIAYARDLAGNEAPPQAVSFTIDRSEGDRKYVDRTPPRIELQTPLPDQTVYSGAPLISALLFDEGSGVDDKNIVVHLDGERVCNSVKMFLPGKSGKSWDWYYYEKAIILYDPLRGEMRFIPGKPLPPGKHHVRIEALDRQGNPARAAEGIFTVVLDDKPPTIRELRPAAGSMVVYPIEEITAKLADEGDSGLDAGSLRLVVNGEEMPGDLAGLLDPQSGRFAYRLPRPLALGAQHVIVLTVRDRAGNQVEARAQVVTAVRDAAPPRIDVLSPAAGQDLRAGGRVVAAIYDLGPAGLDDDSLTITLDGRPLIRGEAYTFERGVLELRLPELPPGPHLLAIAVRDRAGNAAPPTVLPIAIATQEGGR